MADLREDTLKMLNNFFASGEDKECIPPTLNCQVQHLSNVVITQEEEIN